MPYFKGSGSVNMTASKAAGLSGNMKMGEGSAVWYRQDFKDPLACASWSKQLSHLQSTFFAGLSPPVIDDNH